MHKHQSSSPAKPIPPVNDDAYPLNSFFIGRRAESPSKPSRKEVSKCISIWAEIYRLRDDGSEARELCRRSQPWLTRDGSKRDD